MIKEQTLKHWIEHFYGYGSWQAKCWFVAYEEGGGDVPEEVADKLNYFYKNHGHSDQSSLCNIRELYKKVTFKVDGPRADLFSNLFDYRFGKDAVPHGAWKNLIAFVHGYQKRLLPDLLEYQQNSLALPANKSEALIRLYPLPAHNHAWYYSWLDMPQLPYLKSRGAYENHTFPNRVHHIFTHIKEYKPEVVVMYGMNNISQLKKSVQAFYPGIPFKMVKATGRQIPTHHRADLQETTLLITTQLPRLRHNRIETGYDWEAFGRSLRT